MSFPDHKSPYNFILSKPSKKVWYLVKYRICEKELYVILSCPKLLWNPTEHLLQGQCKGRYFDQCLFKGQEKNVETTPPQVEDETSRKI